MHFHFCLLLHQLQNSVTDFAFGSRRRAIPGAGSGDCRQGKSPTARRLFSWSAGGSPASSCIRDALDASQISEVVDQNANFFVVLKNKVVLNMLQTNLFVARLKR